jgi:endogenous inhibitor of DNA gyrase (YacG/DUF329 family)
MGLTTSCPICHKPTASDADADFPFCSERCRLTDLGNWASGRYVISEPAADQTTPEASRPDDADN